MSRLKPEERHEIVLEYVTSIKRSTKVFHLRWSEPALITTKILLTTPPFWYKKYSWRRRHVENMFYQSEIELSYGQIKAFDEVYGGGYKGKRWHDPSMRGKLDSLWERLYGKKPKYGKHGKLGSKNAKKTSPKLDFPTFLAALNSNSVTISEELARGIFDDIDTNGNGFITKEEMDAYLAKLDAMDNLDDISALVNDAALLKLAMSKKVLQCILSDEGLKFVETEFLASLSSQQQLDIKPETVEFDPKLSKLDFGAFLEHLAVKNITISDTLARDIFAKIDSENTGFITLDDMKTYLDTLSAMSGITADVNNPDMVQIVMAKHVLEGVLSEDGLRFVETDFIADLNSRQMFDDAGIECIGFLNKIGDRDIEWEERVFAMQEMNKGLQSGKYDRMLMNDDQVRELLFGLAAQLLDENDNVRNKAVQVVPDVLDECFNKVSNINVVYEHLPEIIDNFFTILDNPKYRASTKNVAFGIDELIDNIINTQHPVAALQLAKIFAGKCNIENINGAETRRYGLQCLSKIMFSLDSPYLAFDTAKLSAPTVEMDKLPPQGDPYREWLDTATYNQPGPSQVYMNRTAARKQEQATRYMSGEISELTLGYGKGNYRKARKDDQKGPEEEDEVQDAQQEPERSHGLMEKTSEEIGTEFVDAVSSGLSHAMMDPNRSNKIHGFKTNHILNQLCPEFSDNLESESKRRYDKWDKGDMQSYPGAEPKELPMMKKIQPRLVTMHTNTKIGITNMKPSLPDI